MNALQEWVMEGFERTRPRLTVYRAAKRSGLGEAHIHKMLDGRQRQSARDNLTRLGRTLADAMPEATDADRREYVDRILRSFQYAPLSDEEWASPAVPDPSEASAEEGTKGRRAFESGKHVGTRITILERGDVHIETRLPHLRVEDGRIIIEGRTIEWMPDEWVVASPATADPDRPPRPQPGPTPAPEGREYHGDEASTKSSENGAPPLDLGLVAA